MIARLCCLFAIIFSLNALPAMAAHGSGAAADKQVLTVLHLLDYVGVDYPSFVINGKITNPAEYAEQKEFAAEVIRGINTLPERPAKEELQEKAQALLTAILNRSEGSVVRMQTTALAAGLTRAYPVTQAPAAAPDLQAASRLYASHCASCHGVSGHGDGPLAAGLNPPPANFHAPERQNPRSVFAFYNTISLGVPGTAMRAYSELPSQQRWGLAFYISQLHFTDAQRAQGKALWEVQGALTQPLDSLAKLTQATPNAMRKAGGDEGVALLAWLRHNPAAVASTKLDPISITQGHLRAVLNSYSQGDYKAAHSHALRGYLEGFELAEPALTARDPELKARIEAGMMALRGLIREHAPQTAVASAVASLQTQLQQASAVLASQDAAYASSFVGSFIILAREGLEVILVLAAMLAFLKKTQARQAVRWVHGGWMLALLAGAATWFASLQLIDISGAGREMTEGFTGLFAAAILIFVGLWLHGKSYAQAWQQYVSKQMSAAMSNGGRWGLAALAFLATYRECFETVLFYQALWEQGAHSAVVAGMAAAVGFLAVIVWLMFRFSAKLPLGAFFTASSVLIAILAVVFTGKGIAALQEAGVLSAHAVPFIDIPLLGIYPNLQGLLLQLLVLIIIVLGMGWNHRRARLVSQEAI